MIEILNLAVIVINSSNTGRYTRKAWVANSTRKVTLMLGIETTWLESALELGVCGRCGQEKVQTIMDTVTRNTGNNNRLCSLPNKF